MNTILNVENIVKTYGKKINIKRALNHIQFSVMEGEFVSIMGHQVLEKQHCLIAFQQ